MHSWNELSETILLPFIPITTQIDTPSWKELSETSDKWHP